MEPTKNKIFALDIGTRSVVGIVAEGSEEDLKIIASDYIEHKQRAMLDGQIHDVELVAKAVRKVKECLENKIEAPIKQVAVAAAGRSLKTVRSKAFEEMDFVDEISREKLLSLELSAVQEAQKNLLAECKDNELNYHCVGYSIVNYQLDGFLIGNLVGQKGKIMGVEILATFLPRVVVDSMFAVLQRCGLEMMSLTLEPIAACTVVIPPNMRMLNIALVDIGAGTSDIAISANGAIIGYDMVPMAGDEITEKLCERYLLDFSIGEIVKRELQTQKEVNFVDVLGIEYNVQSQEIIDFLSDTVDDLSKQISEKIINLNQKPPQAVICIGGGSMTPLFTEKMAENLGLSPQRVAIRGREIISSVGGEENLIGPEAVTPIGIAVTAYNNQGLGFAKVSVNNQLVRLFEVHKGTVADALLAAGIDMKKVYPRLGMALTATVNGKLRIIKGTKGIPAVIKVNEKEATLETSVSDNDMLVFCEALNGQDASGCIGEILPELNDLNVTINGKAISINPTVFVNDKIVGLDEALVDGAKVTYDLPNTLGMVLSLAGMDHLNQKQCTIMINGREAEFDQRVQEGDQILVIEENENVEEIISVFDEVAVGNEETIITINSEQVVIPRINIIFADVLAYTNFPVIPPGPGSRLQMQVNESPAEFTTPLKNGDKVSLYWKKI